MSTLTFYYNPFSGNVRRVWVALLEKQLPFEPVEVRLDGHQFSPEFTEINPLQRIPVLVDGDFRVVESMAILDYVEAQYPDPPLMPKEARAIATVRMAETIAVTDLQPLLTALTQDAMQFPVEAKQVNAARDRIPRILNFFETQLLVAAPYFLGAELTRADIVVGTLLPALSFFGIDLDPYPKLQQWLDCLNQRPSWQQTALRPELIASARSQIEHVFANRGLA